MYLSRDDARSDVILAGATTLFGGLVIGLLTALPLYPGPGTVLGSFLDIAWIFVLTGLVPWLLARYRQDRIAAFGLDGPRTGWRTGLALAVPAVVLGVLHQLVTAGADTRLLGRVGGAGFLTMDAVAAAALGLLSFAVATAGALLLTCFLVVRGREAFRSPDVSLTELLRTFGVGAAGVALLTGLLRAIGAAPLLPSVLQVAGLLALVLVADRLVPPRRTIPRAAVLTPVAVLGIAHVFAFGGLFRGDLLSGLYAGSLAAGTATITAVLLASRDRAWAVVPLFAALHWWPSCLSPLPMEFFAAGC
ncbi:hypothetical protein [Egicoccus halophilus]|uniref:Uncharacterized protein n=1 Tax=Egicoccus halophilus TaxID=1670830 RepID=A0A8J3EVT3_9ACTN|nr:hypothetical protein [Egicoccus halophilus]GGI08795.1 hypothetical protein GCM10011354_30870 [Egicoccus halophilus]